MSCVERVSHHGLTTAVRRLLWLAFIVLGLLLISAVLGGRAHADEQSAAEPESTTDSAGAGLVGALVDGAAEEAERAATSVVEAGSDSLAPVVEPVVETVEPVISPLVEPVAQPVLESVVDEIAPVLAPVTGPVADAGAASVDPATGALGVDEAIESLTTAPVDEASPTRPDEVRPEGRSDLREHRPQDDAVGTVDPRGRDDRRAPVPSLPLSSSTPVGPVVVDVLRGGDQTGEVGDWSSARTTTDDAPVIARSLTTTGVSGTPSASAASVTAVVPESAWPADGACAWGPMVRDVFVPMSCAMELETRPG